MEPQTTKGERCPIQEGEADHPLVANCIKQLNPTRWLLGSSLICEYNSSSKTFSTSFKSEEESILDWSPLDPQSPIKLVRCIQGQAAWKIGEWAYFKSKAWTEKMAMEFAAIGFVQKNAPTVPVPTLLEHYVDETVSRFYTLVSSVSGADLNEAWRTLNDQQKFDVFNQVAEHIHTLAQLKSDKLQSVDNKWVFEPFLSIQPGLRSGGKSSLENMLLNPDETR